MNDTATSTPGSSLLPSGIDALTTIHFVIIGLLALAAIAIIVAGIRRRRTQAAATREVEQHAQEAGVYAPQPGPPAIAEPLPEPSTILDEPASPAPVISPERPLRDEPIAAAAPLEASPATEAADTPAPAPAPVTSDYADAPVTQLKGLGPKVAARLAELRITTVGQIAALSADEAAALDTELGVFRGRMARDRWIDQARLLAAGDRAGFEAVFGKL